MHAIGGADITLDNATVAEFIRARCEELDLDGRSVCVVIPDATRTCPLPLLLGAIFDAVKDRVSSCTAVVALGTHAPMSEEAIRAMVACDGMQVINHEWWQEDTFVHVGVLSADLVSSLSVGLLSESVEVRINRIVVDSDVTLIVGPVLPHEVVGFSGGNKYLFPGLSGQELIDTTHWLGAMITSREIIGTRGVTPVRAFINAAAELVPGERHALCVVVDRLNGGLRSVAFGHPEQAWEAAADVAARTHVTYLPGHVERVLSLIPPRYDDLWTGAKGFYKVEPVVADGGEVVLYAPHIRQVAAMHPGLLDLGYHCRDYFLTHWSRYAMASKGELAHSTHLFGAGTYDSERGETQRVRVTLATGIPEDVVRRINLNYLDPARIDVGKWETDPHALIVRDAGEVLYRVRREST